jgi:hypothetical protein
LVSKLRKEEGNERVLLSMFQKQKAVNVLTKERETYKVISLCHPKGKGRSSDVATHVI